MFNSPKTQLLLKELFKYVVLRLNKVAVKQEAEDASARQVHPFELILLDV